ncbi:hypothetical protein HYH03_011501 [Edaphochlamys debaryana]|uniref:SBP-type domain-containing protein n=1 Tax=Edaphochlamys debaryana TaxID=47281 RepID=A0A835XTW4_9CHLO|nr:hypothetical protein HYH03_011501 [Edaphochlamys debaryana]|eukprot:KAG2490036.1 hypothetical protein HYH03_011501 [Edaphochlamys debaryana]
MADVFAAAAGDAFSGAHPTWAGAGTWDPSLLQLTRSESEPDAGGSGSQTRDDELGAVPSGWPGKAGAPGAAGDGGKGHARAPKGPLVCQVEGCGHDLANEKGYYQRYRVCEPHLKLLSISVDGKQCRFCQQCGRFHELAEFDGNKRSCRARLLQHNARRRKRDPINSSSRRSKQHHSSSNEGAPQGHGDQGCSDAQTGADDFSGLLVDGSLLDDPRGALPDMYSSFSGVSGGLGSGGNASFSNPLPPLLNLSAPVSQSGPMPLGGTSLPNIHMPLSPNMMAGRSSQLPGYMQQLPPYRQQHSPGDLSGPLSGPLDRSLPGQHPHQGLGGAAGGCSGFMGALQLAGGSVGGGMGGGLEPMQMSMGGERGDMVMTDMERRLSGGLLTQSRSATMQPSPQLKLEAPFGGGNGALGPVGPVPGHGHSGFGSGLNGGLGGGGGMGGGGGAGGSNGASGPLPSALGGATIQQAPTIATLGGGTLGPDSLPSFDTDMSLDSYGPTAADVGAKSYGMGASPYGSTASGAMAGAPARPAAAAGSSFDLARRLVAGGGRTAYRSDDLMVRVSIKIANVTPDELPPDLFQRLRNLLDTADSSLVQGFLRPGCCHLVLDVMAPRAAGGLLVAPGELRALLGADVTARCAVLVQQERAAALWGAGEPLGAEPAAVVDSAALRAAGAAPCIGHVSAAAQMLPGGRAVVMVYGDGLLQDGVKLFARIQGGYVPLKARPLLSSAPSTGVQPDPALAPAAEAAQRCAALLRRAGRAASDVLVVTVEDLPGPGLLQLEAQRGSAGLLSECRPCLLADEPAAVAELSAMALRALHQGSLSDLESAVVGMGLALDCLAASLRAPLPKAASSSLSCEPLPDEACRACPGAGSGPVFDKWDAIQEAECALSWAVDSGLVAVSSSLVRLLWWLGQDLQQALEAPVGPDGLSLMHRGVRAGGAMVGAMLGWASEFDLALSWNTPCASGLTPLHVAAVVPDTWALLSQLPSVRTSWKSARSPVDHTTPFQLQRRFLAQRGQQEPVSVLASADDLQPICAGPGLEGKDTAAQEPQAASKDALCGTCCGPACAAVAAAARTLSAGPASASARALLPYAPFLTALCALTLWASPLVGAALLAAALPAALFILHKVSRFSNHTDFSAALLLGLPLFSDPAFELDFEVQTNDRRGQLDTAGVAAYMLLALRGRERYTSALYVCLGVLPVALMQLSRPAYNRWRGALLLSLYYALWQAVSGHSQVLTAIVVCSFALTLLPLNALPLLLVTGVAAWKQEQASGASLAIMTSAVLLSYAREIACRRAWFTRRAVQHKQI